MVEHKIPSLSGFSRRLVNELFKETENQPRCPHIRRDGSGKAYCGKDLADKTKVSIGRYDVCGPASLQLYCLNSPEQHRICIYYKGERVD